MDFADFDPRAVGFLIHERYRKDKDDMPCLSKTSASSSVLSFERRVF